MCGEVLPGATMAFSPESDRKIEQLSYRNPNIHRLRQHFSAPRKKPRYRKPDSSRNGRDHINQLPDECIFEIFSFLPASRDRCACAAVSKKWLVLQATMQNSKFQSHLKQTTRKNFSGVSGLEIRRCLEGKDANDNRLAAMAVGIDARGKLSELCIRTTFPSPGITDSGLDIIGFAFPALKSLTLWSSVNVGNRGLVSISQGCALLEKLDLFDSPFIGDQALSAIAKNCPKISVLNLQRCPQIGNNSLRAFGRFSSKLKSICLEKCPLVNDEGIFEVVSGLPNLEKIKLVSLNISDDGLKAIWKFGRNLKSLCLEGLRKITEEGFSSLGDLENLRVLSLKSCSGLSDASFTSMGNEFLELRQISIRNCDSLTDHGLNELTRFATKLESLKLVECRTVSVNGLIEVIRNCSSSLKDLSLVKCEGIGEPQSSSIELPKCRLLESVTVRNCSGVGIGFLHLIGSTCLDIKHLELSKLSSMTDHGVLAFLRGIKKDADQASVDLNGCFRITDWSVFAITRFFGKTLRSLNLDGCTEVTDISLEIIAHSCPHLLDLDMSKCEITDNGVIYLAKKHQFLKVLNLSGCMNITSDCLDFLELMGASLVGLNLKNCPRLSKNSIEYIRTTLWWCDIII